jgi:cytochrome P450
MVINNILTERIPTGSVVRTGPNTLSFNTATALTAIYGNRDANARRSDFHKTLDAPAEGYSTQSVIDKQEHAFRRRVLSQAFSEKALRESEKIIQQNVETLVKRMGENIQSDGWAETKDFYIWSTFYGFDFTGDLAFGSSFDLMNNEKNRYAPNLLQATGKFFYYVCSVKVFFYSCFVKPILIETR